MLRVCMQVMAIAGRATRERWRDVLYLAAVFGTILYVGAQPGRWRRTVRQAFANQVYSIGVESLPFIGALAILVGIAVVVQVVVWVGRVGQSRLLGPLLVALVARELGPVFANFVAIVKGGSATTTELGIMKVSGDVRVLEAQGIEPLLFLVMPRVLGTAVATLCLTVLFIVGAFGSGFAFGALIGLTTTDLAGFLESVSRSIHPRDVVSILAKSLLPALVTGTICSTEGLSVAAALTEVPLATKRSLSRSLLALFAISAAISLLTYL